SALGLGTASSERDVHRSTAARGKPLCVHRAPVHGSESRAVGSGSHRCGSRRRSTGRARTLVPLGVVPARPGSRRVKRRARPPLTLAPRALATHFFLSLFSLSSIFQLI